ncbi:MAG: response regulator [Chloroflexota bacterium]
MTTKIMVIDDEPAIGNLLIYQLREYDYEVVYISDALVAIQCLERERPELILLDVMMPTISGWDLCREVRKGSAVPIIMITAKHADSDIATGLAAGADDYVTKPFSMIQLHARIESVLRRTANQVQATPTRASTHTTNKLNQHAMSPAHTGHMPAYHAQQAKDSNPQVGHTATPSQTYASLGRRLREERLSRGLSLAQIEHDCKIRWEFLQAIEQENYAYVPRPQLRVILQVYTNYFGIDVRQLASQGASQPVSISMLRYAVFATAMLLVVVVSFYVIRIVA